MERVKGKGAPRGEARVPAKRRRRAIRAHHILWISLFVFSVMVYAYALPGYFDQGYTQGYSSGLVDGSRPAPPGEPPSAYGAYRCTNPAGAAKWSLQLPYPANEDHNTSYYEPATTLLIGDGAPWTCLFQYEAEVWR